MQFRKKGHEIKKKIFSSETKVFGHLKKFLFSVMVAILDTGRH
jgi:hypothetical protein